MGCQCRECQYPHNLLDKPENCTEEQIRECHGENEGKSEQSVTGRKEQ